MRPEGLDGSNRGLAEGFVTGGRWEGGRLGLAGGPLASAMTTLVIEEGCGWRLGAWEVGAIGGLANALTDWG